MTGHVFVIQGDIRRLACDAYLYATDKRLRAGGGWRNASHDVENRLDPETRAGFQSESRFTLPLNERRDAPNEPTPVLTAVPLHRVKHREELTPRLREFFEVGAAVVKRRPELRARAGRDRGLLAVPLFGTGRGGGGFIRGEVFRLIYAESRRAAVEYGVDVAIVLRDARDYALAQMVRREIGDAWPTLSDELHIEAKRLGAIAERSRLVPFMGAGISVSAGAPSWADLLENLAIAAGIAPDLISELGNHDVLDQAAFIRGEFERRERLDGPAFAHAIIDSVDVPRYGIAPPLLAALEAEQAITLNYDRLFEWAALDGGRPRRVIPGPSTGEERWLLKLHGSVDDPLSIVLTREDYLGFNADRAALSSLVKATLMTRHLLFVGFGVKDPHFHEIVHDVRRAVPDKSQAFGTVLTLNDDPVTRQLWRSDLDFVFLPNPRTLDIFLDAVLAYGASSTSYLLADGFASALSRQDQELSDALRHMVDSLPPSARTGSSWGAVEQMLRRFGWGSESTSRSWAELPAGLG